MNTATNTPLKTIQLNITGMSCDGCARSVQNALKNTPGVQNVQVDLNVQTATVTLNPSTSQDDLVSAVEDAGYGVRS